MEIVKSWTTTELIEFLNSYKKVSTAEQEKHNELMLAIRDELTLRQPLIGMIYK